MSKEKSENNKNVSKIKELEAENKQLKTEVDNLKRELAAMNDKKIFHESQDKILLSFERSADNERLFSKKRYTSYIAAIISRTSVFKLYKRIILFAKKYTLLTVSLKIAAYVIALIQSSAIFVVALSVFLVLLPFTFVFGYLTLMISLFGRRRRIKRVTEMTKNKSIAVFFAAKTTQLTNDSFFAGTVREWRDRKEGVAVIVSPHLFLSKGISTSKKPYLLMRVEETDVIIIRKHFFFTLDKRIFKNSDKDVTMIY